MQTADQLLNGKSCNYFVSVSANTKASQAMQLMAKNDIGAVVVIDQGNISGIFSEHDYVQNISLNELISKSTTVQEAMTTNAVYVSSDSTLTECMSIMTDLHINYLLVLTNDMAVGIISIEDLANATIDQQNTTIDNLIKYINSN